MFRCNKIFKLFLAVIFCLTATACWDSQDINKRDIILMLYVDYQDGQYEFAGEIATFNEVGQSPGDNPEKNSITTFDVKGPGLIETRQKLEQETSFKLFVAANRTVIFGPGIAKAGIEEYVSRLLSDIGYRQRVNVVTTSTSVQEFLKLQPKNAPSLGFAIEDILKNLEQNRTLVNTDLGQITEQMLNKNNAFLLPQFDKYNDTLSLSGYAVFADSKKIGFIRAEDSMGLALLMGKNPQPIYTLDINNCGYVVRAIYKDRDIKPVYNSQNELEFNVSYKYFAQVENVTSIKEQVDEENIGVIADKLKEAIRKDTEMAVKDAQTVYRQDYLQFDQYYRQHYPSQYRRIKNWSDVFSNADVNVNVEIHQLVPPPPLFQ